MPKLTTTLLPADREISFQDDLLARSEYGTRLATLVAAMGSGAVLALDAPWGEGKTSFVRMWRTLLRERQVTSIYLDAFRCDHTEDPFFALTTSLLDALQEVAPDEAAQRRQKEVLASAKRAGGKFLGWSARTAIRALTLNAIDDAGVDELKTIRAELSSGAASVTEAIVTEKLVKSAEESDAFEVFRNQLAETASAITNGGAPLVFVVDELDRCRPSFAVSLIERIKHLFDVPSICFLLVLNRTQLQSAICGVYGHAIDAEKYLEKFVHLWFRLPKRAKPPLNCDYTAFTNALLKAHELEIWDDERMLKPSLSAVSRRFELSLREMERLMTNITIFYHITQENYLRLPPLVVALAAIRIRRPNVYLGLASGRMTYDDYRQAVPELAARPEDDREDETRRLAFIDDLMKYGLMTDEQLAKDERGEEIRSKFQQGMSRYGYPPRTSLIPGACESLDMFEAA